MKSKSLAAVAMLTAIAGSFGLSGLNDTSRHYDPPGPPLQSEEEAEVVLAKAQAKRDRKAAKRLKDLS
jgi:hypothetical protein